MNLVLSSFNYAILFSLKLNKVMNIYKKKAFNFILKVQFSSLSFLFLFCFVSCNETKEKNLDAEKLFKKEKEDTHLPFKARMTRQIEASLSIPTNEHYTSKVFKGHLNADNFEDAIITVNRYDFAIDDASKSLNPAKMAELGYVGNYNCFFFYDGKLKKFSNPIMVASSPKAPLKVLFEHIQSDFFSDIVIEYRIRNSAYRSYYLMHQGAIQMMFQWKRFDKVGEAIPDASFLTYDTGTLTQFKDILVSKGKIKSYSPSIDDVYSYDPVIENEGVLLYRFFFDPKQLKYVTRK
jgi:hypothetical protein